MNALRSQESEPLKSTVSALFSSTAPTSSADTPVTSTRTRALHVGSAHVRTRKSSDTYDSWSQHTPRSNMGPHGTKKNVGRKNLSLNHGQCSKHQNPCAMNYFSQTRNNIETLVRNKLHRRTLIQDSNLHPSKNSTAC